MGGQSIDLTRLLALLEKGGPISMSWPGYELRSSQREMLAHVVRAFNGGEVAFIEAGTGVGKSLAYLLPAIIWAVTTGEKVIISTHTIALQEQLIRDEIPRLLKALNLSVDVVIAKGMGRYLCKKLAQEVVEGYSIHENAREGWVNQLESWMRTTQSGELDHFPETLSKQALRRIRADRESCRKRRCPLFKECFFFNARERATKAKILIVNHHLLLSEVARGAGVDAEERLFSKGNRLIIDEAHHLEEIATGVFSQTLSQSRCHHLFRALFDPRWGYFARLNTSMARETGAAEGGKSKKHAELESLLHLSLPADGKSAAQVVEMLFERLLFFFHRTVAGEGASEPSDFDEEGKQTYRSPLRLIPPHFSSAIWRERVAPALGEAIDAFKALLQQLGGFSKLLKEVRREAGNASNEPELDFLMGQMHEMCALLEGLNQEIPDRQHVRWLEEETGGRLRCVQAPLDVDELLADRLFEVFSTVLLCSATMTSRGDFSHLQARLGASQNHLDERTISTGVYPSPFDYRNQVLLCIPTDFPPPNDERHRTWSIRAILRAIETSRGNALILTTSYEALNALFKGVKAELGDRYLLMRQGEASRSKLLEKLRQVEGSVLFATHSFWEGIDVPGEALRMVIIAKLPFQVPSDPLNEARCEKILREGGDPFVVHSLPSALTKFRQGFGRLIRKGRDRGCVLCLDSRMVSRYYGRYFIEALPETRRSFAPMKKLLEEMQAFYRSTYSLTRKPLSTDLI